MCIIKSVITCNNPNAEQNYWRSLHTQLQALQSEQNQKGRTELEKRLQLEKVLKAEGKYGKAGLLELKDWIAYRQKYLTSDYANFTGKCLELADTELAMGEFSKAIEYYNMALYADQHQKKPAQRNIARDLNNIGLAYHMLESTADDERQRKAFADLSLAYYRKAENSFSANKLNCDAYFCLLNQYFLLQDCGKQSEAAAAFSQAEACGKLALSPKTDELRRTLNGYE